ncbi:preprotein translocase subunit SecY [Murdochiella vaginalis]|uniref:preprotein translocase subunit SecY n=1 Tax=Murdochiella vaginalis TaxID=1852373 RepID=UPI0008FE2BFA|nr:preprotein translocase subunit SecY [Murdochiella vaginalis]
MLSTLKNAWATEQTKKRIIFTVLMLIILRLGNALPIPFANLQLINQIYNSVEGSLLGIMNMISGGGLANLSVLALGVGPYITSSIVIQLLTFAIPQLEEISKEGEEGRKKIQQYTKYLGVALAVVQAFALVQGIFSGAFGNGGALEKAIAVLVMVAGASFVVWIGDLITEHGVGNGVSFIIFLGIVVQMPGRLYAMIQAVLHGQMNPLVLLLIIAITIAITVVVVLLNEGERKVPVQYAKRVVGRKMYGGQATHIPIKVNMAGVMPIIFASALLAIPQTLALLFGGGVQRFVAQYLTPQGWIGFIVQHAFQVLLIILFAYFYNSIQFNAYEYSRNLQQSGGFLPGIRPGKPTTDYLQRIVGRITLVGAIVLAVLSVIPGLVNKVFSVSLGFGGTSIIIVVGVVLEMVRTLEAQLQMRHYRGFLKR